MPNVFGFSLFGGKGPHEALSERPEELVSLESIASPVCRKHPELQLTKYDMQRGDVCSNAVAVPHNACRLEMAEMWTDILPSLTKQWMLSEDDARDLNRWWMGFARFALTTSMVDDLLMEIALKDIVEDYDKEARALKFAYRRFQDKNHVTSERATRAMNAAVDDLCKTQSEEALACVVDAWKELAATLSDIYDHVERFLKDVDKWRREEFAVHPGLERRIVELYTDRKRFNGDVSKCGEMIVILTRWLDDETVMRQWMERNLHSRDYKLVDKWLDSYFSNRLQLVIHFHRSLNK